MKAVIRWEPFNNLKRLVISFAWVQQALSEQNSARIVVSVEERMRQEQPSSSFYNENSSAKKWSVVKLKRKSQNAAKFHISRLFSMKQKLVWAKAESANIN